VRRGPLNPRVVPRERHDGLDAIFANRTLEFVSVYRGLSGATMAPIFQAANWAMANCGQLGSKSAIRSPRVTPSA